MSNPGINLLQGFPQNLSSVVGPNGQLTTQWLYLLQTLWARTGTAQGGAVSPTGMLMAYSASTPPVGWLICDGTAIDRIIYAALFSVIGTTWGAGNGTTTFNVPNLANRFLIGAGNIPFGTRGGNVSYSPMNTGSGYASIIWCIKT